MLREEFDDAADCMRYLVAAGVASSEEESRRMKWIPVANRSRGAVEERLRIADPNQT